jgi:hypothetical protein
MSVLWEYTAPAEATRKAALACFCTPHIFDPIEANGRFGSRSTSTRFSTTPTGSDLTLRLDGANSSPIFPRVEDSEDEDIGIGYFVANFIISHQKSAYFSRVEFSQPRSQMRVRRNSFRARDQLANNTNRGGAVNGMQKFVKANKI